MSDVSEFEYTKYNCNINPTLENPEKTSATHGFSRCAGAGKVNAASAPLAARSKPVTALRDARIHQCNMPVHQTPGQRDIPYKVNFMAQNVTT